jgi:beta-galactosidase
VRVGVCYYPEQWPRERWAIDAAMMRDAGLEIVRIGEFAWSRIEPAAGQYRWEWLDAAIDTLTAAGLSVMLGTPTATPPIWLVEAVPDIVAHGPDRRPRPYGSRRFTCPTSPTYRREAQRIVTEMVQRYASRAAVTAWQIDNEPGNHDSARCWCPACEAAFSRWLSDRFDGDIDALNAAWGTVFWSQEYPTFDHVQLPRPTMTQHTPHLLLAHRRFSSGQISSFIAAQVPIVRAAAPNAEITVNHFIGDIHIDQSAMVRSPGFDPIGAHDNYPHGYTGPLDVALAHDHARGLAGPDGRGWVMEQQPGPVNWTPTNPPVRPGEVRTWSWQAALHGIDTLLYFRWRAGRFGQEQYHAGLLRHDASPNRGLGEATRFAREAKASAALLASRQRAKAAVLFSMEDTWAIEIDPHLTGLTYRQLLLGAYQGLRRLGVDVDVVSPTDDLTRYALVVAPALHLHNAEREASLRAALAAGTTVVLGPRSLVKTWENAWVDAPEPAGFSALLGARVRDTLTQSTPGLRVLAGKGERPAAAAGPFVDVYELLTADALEGTARPARVIARYEGGWLDGEPAAVARGNLAVCGASSTDAWIAVLVALLGKRIHSELGSPLLDGEVDPPTVERFIRDGHMITIDHESLTVSGVPGVRSDGAGA